MVNVTPYRLALVWLIVSHRREYFIGSLAHRIIKSHQPYYLYDNLPPVSRSARAGTGYFVVSHARITTILNCFPDNATHIINSLGRQYIYLNTMLIENFKCLLHTTLLERDRREGKAYGSYRERLIIVSPSLPRSSILSTTPTRSTLAFPPRCFLYIFILVLLYHPPRHSTHLICAYHKLKLFIT